MKVGEPCFFKKGQLTEVKNMSAISKFRCGSNKYIPFKKKSGLKQ